MEKELFVDIIGYDGNYKIGNNGSVYSVKSKRILYSGTNPKRYKSVVISYNNVKKTYMIHRLVAVHFIENPLNKATVNHIDGNKLNNNYMNLEWNTYSENNKHKYSHLGYSNFDQSTRSIKINKLDLSGDFICTYSSIRHASRELKRSRQDIIDCYNGIYNHLYKYILVRKITDTTINEKTLF